MDVGYETVAEAEEFGDHELGFFAVEPGFFGGPSVVGGVQTHDG